MGYSGGPGLSTHSQPLRHQAGTIVGDQPVGYLPNTLQMPKLLATISRLRWGERLKPGLSKAVSISMTHLLDAPFEKGQFEHGLADDKKAYNISSNTA